MKKLAAVVLAAILGAGAARAGSIEVDFDPKAEFERYKIWAWVPERDQGHRGVLAGATMRDRVEAGLVGCLKRAGLRQAGPDEKPDVLVRYQGDIGSGKTITTSAGSVPNWSNPAYATVQFTEMTATLIVDLIDAGSNTLAWRLYVDEKYAGPNDPPGKFRSAVEKGFKKYPPSPSSRSRKAREEGK